MRIHFFVRTLNEKRGGGSHYNAIAYIRALRAHGHEVTIHVLYGKGSNAYPSDMVPIAHDGLGKSFLGERAYLAQLLRTYESDADVFFLYAVEFTWGGGFYRRTGGTVPVVVYMDAYLASMRCTTPGSFAMAWYGYKRWPWDKTTGLLDARGIDRFLPCSPAIGSTYQRFGFPKRRFSVLPNIVPDSAAPRAHQSAAMPVNLVYVGRLTYDKGIDLLLAALSKITMPWKLTVVGDGEMRPLVEKAAKQYSNVVFHGWVPQGEVGRFYAEADIFIHPARWPDPAPRAIVDALWNGLPVVVPDTGGSAWIAGEAGAVFKTGNQASLERELRPLIEDSKLRARRAAYARAQSSRFAETAVYPLLEEILRSASAS